MTLINAYSANQINGGDEALFVIKVMVTDLSRHGRKKELVYRFYRCPHPLTRSHSNLENVLNMVDSAFEQATPQGDRVIGSIEDLEAIARLLFPILIKTGATPDLS